MDCMTHPCRKLAGAGVSCCTFSATERGWGMNESMQEAEARGLDRGWDAANYAEAYGQPGSVECLAATVATDHYPRASDEWAAFVDWFKIGWNRFIDDRWQDGEPRNYEDVTPEDYVNRESWKQHALA